MTPEIETMKAALLAAGKTVPEDASADDIELMHLELEAEEEEAAKAAKPPLNGVGPDGQIYENGKSIGMSGASRHDDPPGNPGVEGVDGAPRETYLSALARLQTPEAGSKTPAVIEWARANLSKKEFSERYPNLA